MGIYSQAMEQGLKDGLEQGLEQGRAQGLIQGHIRGKQEAVLELLEDRGSINEELQQKIMSETDMKVLKSWLKLAGKTDSMAEFEMAINGPV